LGHKRLLSGERHRVVNKESENCKLELPNARTRVADWEGCASWGQPVSSDARGNRGSAAPA
jgi:hypothetical protein